MLQKCVLDPEKTCIECGECNKCDLDPGKICDNCCKCIESDKDFETIKIDRIEANPSEQNHP
ncbi:MAG: hypothetical protein SO147_06720 [Clostridia bacterium]|nr:hypothetical protein [Clostridia bacterium]